MKFDLRDRNLKGTPFLIELDGVKTRRVIAFDTDAETLERLKVTGFPESLILYNPEIHGETVTHYKGMVTEIVHGPITVWGLIESQADLDAHAGRRA